MEKKAILRNCCITPDGRRCLKQTMKNKENLDKQKREKEEIPGKGEYTETMLITHKGLSQYTLKQGRKREKISRRESGKKRYGEEAGRVRNVMAHSQEQVVCGTE